MRKRLSFLVGVTLYFGIIGFQDRKYFFPLSAQSDLRFQLVGECLELLAMAGVCFLLFSVSEKLRREASPQSGMEWALAGLSGAAMSLFVLFSSWRSFFPNNALDLSAGSGKVFEALFMGAAFCAFSQAFPAKRDKPSADEERSVI